MVSHQCGFPHEPSNDPIGLLIALRAAEWFLISVDSLMSLQMSCLIKLLVALRAAEWFLISVVVHESLKSLRDSYLMVVNLRVTHLRGAPFIFYRCITGERMKLCLV